MARYAAQLLFRFAVAGEKRARRSCICEERIVTFRARSARAAIREAKRRGRRGGYTYKNEDGQQVAFQFVGIMELLKLDPVCESDEVWYDIKQRMNPETLHARFIPPVAKLHAVAEEAGQ